MKYVQRSYQEQNPNYQQYNQPMQIPHNNPIGNVNQQYVPMKSPGQQSIYIAGTTPSQPIVLYPRPLPRPFNPVNMQIYQRPTLQQAQFSVPRLYSSMRPCMEILARHADEYHFTYTGPESCGAGYHVGYGDVVGLQYHLDSSPVPVDSNYFEFADKQEPLVLIASTYCSGRKLISILKCLKDYKAKFSKFDPKTQKTALHRLFDNTALRKDVTERSGGVRKYVDCVTSYDDVQRNCNINARDYEGKTILTFYMIDQFYAIKPEEKKEIVSLLLECGADPNEGCSIKSIFYTFEAPTALFMAIHYDWPTDILLQICKKGCYVNMKDSKQRNVLSLVTSERKPDYMRWLLENCADLSKSESLESALKHSGNKLSRESLILRFFNNGKRKKVFRQEMHDKRISSRDNMN
ncbi:3384_t:CDS:2 [Dentiscutata erythropus]|uniref:3384_t:CDS:1 n=1 Tax=Dentiscutata erythropus TaxID=1348616 RepID=A0A9N9HH03_9GLOM|nr:3384_t:CDS:2 [Dentiscutata erythropus]